MKVEAEAALARLASGRLRVALIPTAMKNDRWYRFLLAFRRRAETSGFLGFRRTAGGPHSRPRHEP